MLAGVLHSGAQSGHRNRGAVQREPALLAYPVRCTTTTLRIASIHDLEHLTFLVLGLLFWDQVDHRVRHDEPAVADGPCVGGACRHGRQLAPGDRDRLRHASPLRVPHADRRSEPARRPGDRGGVMWVPGSVPFLIALLYLGIRWFDVEDRRASIGRGDTAMTRGRVVVAIAAAVVWRSRLRGRTRRGQSNAANRHRIRRPDVDGQRCQHHRLPRASGGPRLLGIVVRPVSATSNRT